jgi:hypothetical protein
MRMTGREVKSQIVTLSPQAYNRLAVNADHGRFLPICG